MALFRKVFVNKDDSEAGLGRKLDQILASDYTPREKIAQYSDELYTARDTAEKAKRKQRDEMRELLRPPQPPQAGFSDAQFQELRRLLAVRPPTVLPPTPVSSVASRVSEGGESLMARRPTSFSLPTTPTRSLEDAMRRGSFLSRLSSNKKTPSTRKRRRSLIPVPVSGRIPVSRKLAVGFGVPQLGDDGKKQKRARKPTKKYSPPWK